MTKFKRIYPFWYQYEVSLRAEHPEKGLWSGGLVNVIVFSGSDDEARAKCGPCVAGLNLEITELKRCSVIRPEQIEATGPVFKDLYKNAEQFGIAARFDGWKTSEES